MAGRPADHLATVNGGDALAQRLGSRLRDRRLALKRTLSDVAGEAGISVSYLSVVEKGANLPSVPGLARLVHALRLTLHELLREEDRGQVGAGEIVGDGPGVRELDHPDLRLRVASLVSRAGGRGQAPLTVSGAAVFVFVERGAILLDVDGASYALGAGDALDAVDVGTIEWESLGETETITI